ncbi:MAG: S-layer homology domain-containing protein [Bacillota bacterium]|nr:S-layer homology domain-containing protein [Bacillota bacterium]
MKKRLIIFSLILGLMILLQFQFGYNIKILAKDANYDTIGSIGGPTSSVAITGNYVYVGKGMSILVLKNVNGSLTQLDSQINLPSYVSDMEIEGKMLYAAAGGAGLYIIDISSPTQPKEMGSYTSAGFAESLAVKGNTAYLANGSEGLQILDISNPEQPVSLGQVYKGKYAFGVAVSGNNAYIAASDDGLLVADISDRNSPKELAVYDTPGIARGVLIDGKYAYVADDWKGVAIIDITDPAKPNAAYEIPTAGRAYGLALHEKYLYIADAYMGLRVFYVKNLSKPEDITSFAPNESQMYKVKINNNLLFCADRVNGVMCFGIDNPKSLVLKGIYSHTVPIPQVLPYALQYWDNQKEITRLVVIGVLKESELNPDKEITKAELAKLLCSSLRLEAAPKGKKATYADVPLTHPNYGYIEKSVKLGLITSKDKTHFAPDDFMTYGEVVKCLLELVNRTPECGTKLEDYIQEADKLGLDSELCRGDEKGNVVRANALAMLEKTIFEITDKKTEKTLLESKFGIQLQASPMVAIDVATKGNYAYVLAGYSGLSIADISNPSKPRQVAHLDFPESAIYIRLNGNYAYIFANFSVYVVDISDPLHPNRVYCITSHEGGPARGISIDGDRMYVADEWGVKIYSIKNSAKPNLIAVDNLREGSDLPISTSDIAVRNGIAYVAFEQRGIEIYDFTNPKEAKYCGSYLGSNNMSFIPNLQFSGSRAFVNCYNRIEILDISDIMKPRYISTIDNIQSLQNNFRVDFIGSTVFVPNGSDGIIAADLTDVSSIKISGAIDTPGLPVNLSTCGKLVYISDDIGGMCIINQSGDGLPISAQSTSIASAGGNSCSLNTDIFCAKKAEKYALSGSKAETALKNAAKSFTEILTVRNTNDCGTGSLQWCIEHIKKGGRIIFDTKVFSPSKPATIHSGFCLNRVDNITIDASNAGVILDGSKANEIGINILTNGNVIKGLQIQNFQNCAIYIGGSNNIIGGSRTKGSGPSGEGNVIIKTGGVGIYGQRATDNIIVGNNIGVKADGKTAAGNKDGISLRDLASCNTIGIDKPEYRNVISANQGNGISSMEEAFGNLMEGNYIGTDITGMEELGNNSHGISSELCGGFGNVVKNNVTCGNRRVGIILWDNRASYNVIINNKSGIGADGIKALPNEANSIAIGGGVGGSSFGNVIGGGKEYKNILYKKQFDSEISINSGMYDTIINGVVYKYKDSDRY